MKRLPPILVFTLLRLAVFLVPFGLLMLLPIFREQFPWLAAVFAALIGLSLSMIFLRRPMGEVAETITARREARHRERAAEEDALLDAEEATLPADEASPRD